MIITGSSFLNGITIVPATIPSNPNLVVHFLADSSNSNVMQIELATTANVPITDVTIDWGDGNVETAYDSFSNSWYHTYAVDNQYTINISGNSLGGFKAYNNYTGLIGVSNWGNFALEDLSYCFLNCYDDFNLVPNNLPSTVNNVYRMFYGAQSFNDANIVTWNTANVTDMDQVFVAAYAFNQPIGNWNTGNVISMEDLFREANTFNQNINNWNTSNVTNMGGMFFYATDFNQPLNNWNTSNTTTMGGMFDNAISFNQDIGNWNTNNVTYMGGMFNGASNFNQDIGNWNVGSVTNMDGMFWNATNFNQDLTTWCVVNIPSEPANFATSSALITGNKPLWGTCTSYPTPSSLPILMTYDSSLGSNVEFDIWGNVNLTIDWGDGNINQYIGNDVIKSHTYATSNIFNMSIYGSANNISTNGNANGITSVIDWGGVNGLYYISLSGSAVTNVPPSIPSTFTWLTGTFAGCTNFNDSNVTLWDTSNITDMFQMFQTAYAFNQDISSWNTSNVISFNSMFSFANSFNQNINSWDTSNAVDTSFMFSYANSYNQPMNSWDTSKVINMNQMFQHATSFNGNITTWNVSNVVNMTNMFREAHVFNQNIGSWNTSNVSDMSLMFYFANAFNQNIGSWNTGNVGNMYGTFWQANAFNQNIGGWNTSNVTDMSYMFYFNSAFNQNLTTWCVTNIVSEPVNFAVGSALTAGNKPVWGTCPP